MKNYIKELRNERDLLQQELDDVCGVSRQTVIAIENKNTIHH